MGSNILWLDIETTGFDAQRHGIIQIAALVDSSKGEILDEINLYMKPFKNDIVSKESLDFNNITIQDLKNDDKYIPPNKAFEKFTSFLEKWINKYDKSDKFIIAGKNIKEFDIVFLRRWFDKNSNIFYGSYFHYPYIDIDTEIAKLMVHNDFILKNYQLLTLCEFFGIKLNEAHNAYHDIKATREIYYLTTE